MWIKLLILALFVAFCGGTSSEGLDAAQETSTTAAQETSTTTVQETSTTTVQETSTTTVANIPNIPAVDFDIQEIYNTKLVVELCEDAKDIENTSEECLKQYLENLEIVFGYAERLETYINDLVNYFEEYPDQMTDQYKNLFDFINTEWQSVPPTYGTCLLYTSDAADE